VNKVRVCKVASAQAHPCINDPLVACGYGPNIHDEYIGQLLTHFDQDTIPDGHMHGDKGFSQRS
jgi:hypothetical protein